MNITSELEKLVALRDQGNLSEAEFKQAKSKLLTDEPVNSHIASETFPKPDSKLAPKSVPGIGLAIGVFLGNFLIISITSGQVVRGFTVGLIAAALVIIIYTVMRLAKQN